MDKFGLLWFTLSSAVVTWDTLFVLLRPRSLPGGDLHSFFQPYALYIYVDKRYGNMADTFGIAQAWCNWVEIALNLATLTLLVRKNRGAYLCGFLVSTMTFWKTVIYLLQYSDLCNGGYMVAHLTWSELLGLLLLPSSCWVVVPFYFMVSYGRVLRAGLLWQVGTKRNKTD